MRERRRLRQHRVLTCHWCLKDFKWSRSDEVKNIPRYCGDECRRKARVVINAKSHAKCG